MGAPVTAFHEWLRRLAIHFHLPLARSRCAAKCRRRARCHRQHGHKVLNTKHIKCSYCRLDVQLAAATYGDVRTGAWLVALSSWYFLVWFASEIPTENECDVV